MATMIATEYLIRPEVVLGIMVESAEHAIDAKPCIEDCTEEPATCPEENKKEEVSERSAASPTLHNSEIPPASEVQDEADTEAECVSTAKIADHEATPPSKPNIETQEESQTTDFGYPLRFKTEYWDFEADHRIECNVTSLEDLRAEPNPELELSRAKEVQALRKRYIALCQDRLCMNPPAQSFDRWLLGQLIVPRTECTTEDPLFKCPQTAMTSPVIKREIMNSLPAPTYISWSARKSANRILSILQQYMSKARDWMFKLPERTKEDEEQVLAALKTAEDSLRSRRSDAEGLTETFENLTAKCRPIFERLFATSLDEIMTELSDGALKITELLRNARDSSDLPSHPAGAIIVKVSNSNQIALSYRDDVQTVSKLHFEKLTALFVKHNPSVPAAKRHLCMYVLLRRYATLFGIDVFESASMHAALPAGPFRVLQEQLGVCHENFASPLNCFFSRFNSAFPDTDAWFGSHGSFRDFRPTEGSFETGPPYTEEVMEQTALHVTALLAASEKPLSFVVFVPDWRKPLADGLRIMEASEFLQDDFVCKGRSHQYVVGHQHLPGDKAKERFFVLPFDTHVYLLQNKAGAIKWPKESVMQRLHSKMQQPNQYLSADTQRSQQGSTLTKRKYNHFSGHPNEEESHSDKTPQAVVVKDLRETLHGREDRPVTDLRQSIRGREAASSSTHRPVMPSDLYHQDMESGPCGLSRQLSHDGSHRWNDRNNQQWRHVHHYEQGDPRWGHGRQSSWRAPRDRQSRYGGHRY